MATPYYQGQGITLWHGDCREVLPSLDLVADCVVTDPPYAETSLEWDQWPDGWPTLVASVTSSMWCFGSMRMFLDRRDEFAAWKFGQDVVWEKTRGTSFVTDRFARVHEHALHWYRGPWSDIHHVTPREQHLGKRVRVPVRTAQGPGVHGARGQTTYIDDGMRLARSVRLVPGVKQGQTTGDHPTEKPIGFVSPLVQYACPPGGLVLDVFAGSGPVLMAARELGMRAVGIEGNERYCELIAKRLSQLSIFTSDEMDPTA